MFDSAFGIRKAFVSEDGVRALQRRFMLLGLLNVLLLPFIMIFMVIYFFLENAEEFHSKKVFKVTYISDANPLIFLNDRPPSACANGPCLPSGASAS
jgi:hypothetical protein